MGLNLDDIKAKLGIGGNTAVKRDIDFIKVYRSKGITADSVNLDAGEVAGKLKFVGIGVAVVLVAYTAILGVTAVVKKTKLSSMQEYVVSSADAQRYNEIQEMQTELQSISSYNGLIDKVTESIKTYPPFYNDDYTAVLAATSKVGVTIDSIDYDKGMIYLMLVSPDAATVSKCIDELRSTKRFFDVTYNGYDSESRAQSGGGYGFSIKCKLKKGGSVE
jgi:hypothetical protein